MFMELSQNLIWLFNTRSRVQPADWLTFENNEEATVKVKESGS